MYKDSIMKINFYKEMIMQNLINRGKFPDSLDIQKQIDKIDTGLSIFKSNYIVAGEDFDVAQFNQDLLYIWNDLLILYKLVYEIAVTDYKDLEEYIDYHLKNLESVALKYANKTKLEMSSTSLGKTIFFQANGYDLEYRNNDIVITLPTFETREGAKLSFMFDCDNIEPEQVIFNFGGHNCSPYSYNKDRFTVPGKIKTVTYDYTLPEDQIINTAFKVNITDFEPSADNSYIIMGGKDNLSFFDTNNNQSIVSKQRNTACNIGKYGRVEFYVYNGTFINFDFSQEPISKNFTGTSISNLEQCKKIVIECDDKLVFDFITDGQIYAERAIGMIKDNELYYPETTNTRDFLIEEYTLGEPVIYDDATVTIINVNDGVLNINSIAIKEQSAVDVILE